MEIGQGEFGSFARQAFYWLEWLPIRLTAATFAIVGDFEDTVYCWRTQAASWPDSEAGILLASGAGALGVRLGMPIPQGGLPLDRPELASATMPMPTSCAAPSGWCGARWCSG